MILKKYSEVREMSGKELYQYCCDLDEAIITLKKYSEIKEMSGKELHEYCCDLEEAMDRDKKKIGDWVYKEVERWFFQKKKSTALFRSSGAD